MLMLCLSGFWDGKNLCQYGSESGQSGGRVNVHVLPFCGVPFDRRAETSRFVYGGGPRGNYVPGQFASHERFLIRLTNRGYVKTYDILLFSRVLVIVTRLNSASAASVTRSRLTRKKNKAGKSAETVCFIDHSTVGRDGQPTIRDARLRGRRLSQKKCGIRAALFRAPIHY